MDYVVRPARMTLRVLGFVLATFSFALLVHADVQTKTTAYPNKGDGFARFNQRIEQTNPRNLLARKAAKAFGNIGGNSELVDGSAGEACEQGRVFYESVPSVVTFYLGAAKPIHEIGIYSFNGDSRSNQDFEIRLANNAAKPGQMPKFDAKPTFTSGDKILGFDGGGAHTAIASADGKPIAPGAYDWVEFRFWPTYPSKAGDAAKTGKVKGATVVVELEVLGEPADAIVISAQEKAKIAALRQLGDRPPYVKKDTWQETMQATREATVQWESDLDVLMLGRAGVTMGPWHIAGPLAADSEDARQIERLGKLDPTKPISLKGKEIAWKPLSGFAEGQVMDLAAKLGAKPGQVVVLARPIALEGEMGGRDGLTIGIGAFSASFRMVGGGSRTQFSNGTGGPNERTWSVREKPGQYHVLAMLPVTKEGACSLWFVPQAAVSKPGAGTRQERISRRQNLLEKVKTHFRDAESVRQIGWEQADSVWVRFEKRAMSGKEYFPTDWSPSQPVVLMAQYNLAATDRLARIEKELQTIEPAISAKVRPVLKGLKDAAAPTTLAAARQRYYAIATLQDAMAEHHRIESIRLAVKDQQETFGAEYPSAPQFLARVDALEKAMNKAWVDITALKPGGLAELVKVADSVASEGKEILLANPVLKFDKLLLGKGGPGFSSNWDGPNNIGGEIVALSPVKPDGQITTVYKGSGSIHDMDLSFDAKKILFSQNVRIHEVNSDGTGYRQVTNPDDHHTKHYDAIRLPSGKIMFVSTACEQAVPCTGQWYVGNLHTADADGKNERRLTFDQDHNWNPAILNNGQVIYTRWEYTDTPHYFTRLLFTMNPDGSNQAEFYGSNSYWPNAMYWARPIPGHPSRIVCVVSGHHGVSRIGEMIILDTAQGRHEASGVVQRIGDRGKAVEPIIEDALVSYVWPRFAHPWPLAQPKTHKGAGKYFLANVKLDEHTPWGIYLVDTFDNMTPILMGNYAAPIPLVERPTPPAIPQRVDPKKSDAQVYVVDINRGGGIKGFPKGAVKSLRIGTHVYRYGGNGDTYGSSYEGGWDPKRILGTVPVESDGSAFFKVPANTPIFVQPLDEKGQSLAIMRSWFTAMPGETLSCVGCHEQGRETAPQVHTLASRRMASDITPFYGPARGFGFEYEVQPVLDRKCVGCHDGKQTAKTAAAPIPDFRSKAVRGEKIDRYSSSYMALAPYVRRPGYESDYHLNAPAEWHVSTSPLFQLLDKGHYNVKLTREERDRLVTWVDFNVPYAPNWSESHRPPQEDQVQRRAKYNSLFAAIVDKTEASLPAPAQVKFEAPPAMGASPTPVKLDGWPLTPEKAEQLQKQTGLREMTLDLGDGVSMTLVPIPAGKFVMGDAKNGLPDEQTEAAVAIDRPFYMARIEVSNRQFARFDPDHDSAYIDARGKDRIDRGYPINDPDQPVVRITWHQAMAFCKWLSQKTGHEVTLPTEAQWEWACRAGTGSPWSFGDSIEKQNAVGNVADGTLRGWAFGRVEPSYNDGVRFTAPGGRFKANAWGLFDMHGNVAEWTRSDYQAYPYVEGDGRNGGGAQAMKTVRGGSWNDTFRYARSASRLGYLPHQPVYNVGFRVVVRPASVAGR